MRKGERVEGELGRGSKRCFGIAVSHDKDGKWLYMRAYNMYEGVWTE